MTIEIAVESGAVLGECPLWSVAEQVLYWVDIEGKAVHRFDPVTGSDEAKRMEIRPGSMVLAAEPGMFLMGAEHQIGWYSWQAGSFAAIADLEQPATGNRLNDGRTDRQGRFWLGSMYERSTAGETTGMLHCVDTDLTTRVVRRDIGVSNGIAFSPSGGTMYFADSPTGTVWQYDYDPESGIPSNERIFTDFAELPGKPDGACVDADGCYWIACVYGWAVARIAPTGALDRLIEVPVEKPSMPMFGGPGLDMLFVTSIADGIDPTTSQPHAGAVLALDPGTTGLAETRFGGV